MKKTMLVLGYLSLLSSCKKDHNSSPGPNPPSSLVTATYQYDAFRHFSQKDTFAYDANKNLTMRTYHYYDTFPLMSGGEIDVVDSGIYVFTVDPATQLPSSYTIQWSETLMSEQPILKVEHNSTSETHNLSFDGQGRLTRDTLVAGNAANAKGRTATYYTYSGNTIVCKVYDMYFMVDPVNLVQGYGLSYTDTITLNNGNMVLQQKQPLSIYDSGARHANYDYGVFVDNYSNYSNPLYSPRLLAALGAFFWEQGGILDIAVDGLSKNLPGGGMIWVADAAGRVLSGTMPGDVNNPGGYFMRYTYNK